MSLLLILLGKYSEVEVLILCPSFFNYHLSSPTPDVVFFNKNHLLPTWIVRNLHKDWAEENLQKRKD